MLLEFNLPTANCRPLISVWARWHPAGVYPCGGRAFWSQRRHPERDRLRVSDGGDWARCAEWVKGEVLMAFSVSKNLPFRSLGLYKSSGKHAARKPRPAAEPDH